MPTPKPVPEQMRTSIGNGFGWCRSNAHVWQPPRARGEGTLQVTKGVVTVEYKCDLCEGTRIDEYVMRSGELLTRRYLMPDDYVLRVKGTNNERPRKADWRREHFKNLLGGN